jgi:hypothetical protein
VIAPLGTEVIYPDGSYPGRDRVEYTWTDVKEHSTDIIVEPGGGAYIGPEAPKAGNRVPFRFRFFEGFRVFELDIGSIDPTVIGIRVGLAELTLTYPQGAPVPPELDGKPRPDGTVVASFMHPTFVVPAKSWADIWTDVLRVHMPHAVGNPLGGDIEKTLRPIVRDGPASMLPHEIGERVEPLPLVELVVYDLAGSFEVDASIAPSATVALEYRTETDDLIITCTQVFDSPTPRGTHRIKSVDRYVLKMPQSLVPGASTHTVDGRNWMISVPKQYPQV